ncbi:hypothetical protein UZ38_35715 [Bacillus amyloliquefaciens]|nr:hypothetical protein UZ38_35715 [Bacillus amyloliquefaciens]
MVPLSPLIGLFVLYHTLPISFQVNAFPFYEFFAYIIIRSKQKRCEKHENLIPAAHPLLSKMDITGSSADMPFLSDMLQLRP